jgi:hypothetical protein
MGSLADARASRRECLRNLTAAAMTTRGIDSPRRIE